MHLSGLGIGLIAFVVIGLFHPLVIQCEYHFSSRIWPLFLVAGLLFLALSLWPENVIWSSLWGVLGFTCLWSIGELRQQAERVRKGWFPANPRRKDEPPV